jgi:hypothetical protein
MVIAMIFRNTRNLHGVRHDFSKHEEFTWFLNIGRTQGSPLHGLVPGTVGYIVQA